MTLRVGTAHAGAESGLGGGRTRAGVAKLLGGRSVEVFLYENQRVSDGRE
jgi:hypothetical protein